MKLDPENKFLEAILNLTPIKNKAILEIGSGSGRITRDLADYARIVYAVDPSTEALRKAEEQIKKNNVVYLNSGVEYLGELPEQIDLAVYSLSLHHIPKEDMQRSLVETTKRLTKFGKILVIEPGQYGSFIDLEEQYGVGCGRERDAKVTAYNAMASLPGWRIERSIDFQTLFHFEDEQDYFQNIVSTSWKGDEAALKSALSAYVKDNKIELYSNRTAYLLSRQHLDESG